MNNSVVQDLMNNYGVHWFKFDGVGSSVVDSKGNALGTIFGATRVQGWDGTGNSLNFDGVDDYVTFNNKILDYPEKSIKFKLKADTIPTRNAIIFDNNGLVLTSNGMYASVTNTGLLRILIAHGNNQVTNIYSTANICDGEWHDVLFTWDGSTNLNSVKLYIDYVLINATTATAIYSSPSANNLSMGKLSVTNPNVDYFKGQLDDFQVYRKALTLNDFYNKRTLLKSDNKVYSIKSEAYSVIPQMSSDKNEFGEVFVSGTQHSYSGWKAFDKILDDLGWLNTVGRLTNAFITYKFNTSKRIKEYVITPSNYNVNTSPKKWAFQGSNDGINWTDLDSVNSFTDFRVGESRRFSIANNNDYFYYRLFIYENNGSKDYIAIGELDMLEVATSIIELSNSSLENFVNYGMSAIDNFDLINTNKNYILQDTVSEDTDGLWKQEINRKPLSIKFE